MTSFGWGREEARSGGDAEQFLQVLLANIEREIPPIADIYRGECLHYTRSMPGARKVFQKTRAEVFDSLTLGVRGCPSLEESLEKFTESETLSGYDAGGDIGEIRVEIGDKISKLPPVLQLHLRRYEYDDDEGAVVKIEDRFIFLETLDMRPYVMDGCSLVETHYKLYAVLVHSGNAQCGVYSVCLRPGGGTQWFEFNDSEVTKITSRQAIDENFGGSRSRHGAIRTAYMLFYVRVDAEKEIFECALDEVPGHIRDYAAEAGIN
jgi:ubiquitin carboxyl-terminal hydrolase 7